MRLYLSVLLDSKHALHNDVLFDETITLRGTRVTYHPYAMGHRDAIWGTDCLEFKPERWLNKDGHFIPQSPFKFTVFQGGEWVYLGKYMTFIHMKYVIATMVSMFILQAEVEYSTMRNPKLIQSLTTRMKGGFLVLFEKKKVDW